MTVVEYFGYHIYLSRPWWQFFVKSPITSMWLLPLTQYRLLVLILPTGHQQRYTA